MDRARPGKQTDDCTKSSLAELARSERFASYIDFSSAVWGEGSIAYYGHPPHSVWPGEVSTLKLLTTKNRPPPVSSFGLQQPSNPFYYKATTSNAA